MDALLWGRSAQFQTKTSEKLQMNDVLREAKRRMSVNANPSGRVCLRNT